MTGDRPPFHQVPALHFHQPIKSCRILAGEQWESARLLVDAQDGEFVRDLTPPGPLSIDIRATGYEHKTLDITIETGPIRDLGDILLAPEVRVRGELFHPDGRHFVLPLQCYPADEPPRKWPVGDLDPRSIPVNVMSNGTFEIVGLSRTRYVIRGPTDSKLTTLPVLVDATRGTVEGVQIRLQHGTQTAIMLDRAPGAELDWFIVDSNGLPVFEEWGVPVQWRQAWLAPGSYVVKLTLGEKLRAEQSFSVAGKTAEVHVALQ